MKKGLLGGADLAAAATARAPQKTRPRGPGFSIIQRPDLGPFSFDDQKLPITGGALKLNR